jgi:starch synthase
VVEDGVTGLLVPYEARPDGTGTPADPTALAAALAEKVNELLADPVRAEAMGRAGRARAVERFGWDVAAAETLALYERLLG